MTEYQSITRSYQVRCSTCDVTIDFDGTKFKNVWIKRGQTGSCSMNLVSKMCRYMSLACRKGDIKKVIKELREDGEQCYDGKDGTKPSCTQAIANALEEWTNRGADKIPF